MDEEKSLWPGRIGLVFAIIIASSAGLWLLPDAIRQHASELQAGDYIGIATMLGGHLAAIVAVAFLVLYVLFLRGWYLERSLVYLLIIALSRPTSMPPSSMRRRSPVTSSLFNLMVRPSPT